MGSIVQEPRIVSRFEYMYKPLTGVVNGTTPCLFLAIDNVLGGRVLADAIGGAREYAGGGPSSGSRPVEDVTGLGTESGWSRIIFGKTSVVICGSDSYYNRASCAGGCVDLLRSNLPYCHTI